MIIVDILTILFLIWIFKLTIIDALSARAWFAILPNMGVGVLVCLFSYVFQMVIHVVVAGEYEAGKKIKIESVIIPSNPSKEKQTSAYVVCEDGEILTAQKSDVQNLESYVIPKYKFIKIFGFYEIGEIEVSRKLVHKSEKE